LSGVFEPQALPKPKNPSSPSQGEKFNDNDFAATVNKNHSQNFFNNLQICHFMM
jgi:hypothetical protein